MQNRKHAHKFSLNYFCLFGLLNCLSNKVIQIKFLLQQLIERAVCSSKYWKLHQLSN